jgi:hypothetical protein
MTQLNKQQAESLAGAFLDMAKAVDDYAWEHRAALSGEEKAALDALRKCLADACEDMTAKAIALALDDLQPVVARIGRVSERAHEAVRRMKETGQVIRIASSVVALGAAVAAADVAGIGSAVENLAGQLHPGD